MGGSSESNLNPMNYNLFLFSKLYDSVIGIQYEVDYMYDDLQELYKEYDESSFNNAEYSDYDCMLEFLTANKSRIFDLFSSKAEASSERVFFRNHPELNP